MPTAAHQRPLIVFGWCRVSCAWHLLTHQKHNATVKRCALTRSVHMRTERIRSVSCPNPTWRQTRRPRTLTELRGAAGQDQTVCVITINYAAEWRRVNEVTGCCECAHCTVPTLLRSECLCVFAWLKRGWQGMTRARCSKPKIERGCLSASAWHHNRRLRPAQAHGVCLGLGHRNTLGRRHRQLMTSCFSWLMLIMGFNRCSE